MGLDLISCTCNDAMNHYGTNVKGSEWIKKHGDVYSKCIPSWKKTTYSKLFIEICECIGIITTSKALDDEIIKKYELVKLTEKQYKLVDMFIGGKI